MPAAVHVTVFTQPRSFSAIRPCMFNVRLARDSGHWADMRGQVKGPLHAALSLLQHHKVGACDGARPIAMCGSRSAAPALDRRRISHVDSRHWIFWMLKIGPPVVRCTTRGSLDARIL